MSQTVRWLSILCLAIVFLLNLFYTSKVGQHEIVTITGSSWQWIPVAVVLTAVLIFWNFFSDRISERRLFTWMAVFYVIAGFYFIFNINPTIRDDAKSVYDAAAAMAAGDYSSLDSGGYLYVYPYQIGMVTYDRIVRLFSDSVKFLEILNLVQVLGINWFCFRLADLFFHGNRKINNLTILLTFVFLPQLFFVIFKYGLIPGFFFSIGSFYFLTRYLKKNRLLYLVVAVGFAVAASCIKLNYLIGVIAAAAILVIEAVGNKKWKFVLIACIMLITSAGAGKVLKSVCELESGVKMSQGMHTFFWIVMGTDIDNEVRGPGWYNSIGWEVLRKYDFDVEKSNEEARRLMGENIQKIQDNPGKSVSFFKQKTISLWCDPIFESLWSGLTAYELETGSTQNPLLLDLYSDGISEKISAVFTKALLVLITAGTVIFLLFHWKKDPVLLYPPLYFLGGFLFHSFWEAKSQYMYTYIFLLIPLCASEIHSLSEWLKRFVDVRRKRRERVSGKAKKGFTVPPAECEKGVANDAGKEF